MSLFVAGVALLGSGLFIATELCGTDCLVTGALSMGLQSSAFTLGLCHNFIAFSGWAMIHGVGRPCYLCSHLGHALHHCCGPRPMWALCECGTLHFQGFWYNPSHPVELLSTDGPGKTEGVQAQYSPPPDPQGPGPPGCIQGIPRLLLCPLNL